MATTSKKHREFVGEPMRDKPVTKLPGVGKARGQEFTKGGFTKVGFVY